LSDFEDSVNGNLASFVWVFGNVEINSTPHPDNIFFIELISSKLLLLNNRKKYFIKQITGSKFN